MSTFIDEFRDKVTLKDYVRIIFKRKDLIVIPILSVFLISMIGSFFMPKKYRATTIIKIEQKSQDLNPLDRGSADKSRKFVQDLLKTFREELLSYANLTVVLNHPDIDMLRSAGKSAAAQENVIEGVRANILTSVRGMDVIRITYEGEDRHKVYKVVDQLSTRYIEMSLEKQKSMYQSTIGFLQKRLRDSGDELELAERKLRRFKEENLLNLPGQGGTMISKLSESQSAYMQVQMLIEQDESELDMITRQLSGEEPVVISETTKSLNPVIADLKLKKHELGLYLNNLLLLYTEKHPEVIETKRAMETIDSQLDKEEILLTSNETSENNPIYQALKLNKQEIEQNLSNMRTRGDQIKRLVDGYQSRIQEMPEIEQEFFNVERNYRISLTTYESMKKQLESKILSQQIELAEQGIRFNRIEPPRVPQFPFKPNRVKIGLLGLAMGIFLSGALIILAEYSDHSFRSYTDANEHLKIPILGSIAAIKTEADLYHEKRGNRRKYIWTFASFVVILILSIPVIMMVTH